MERKQVVIKKGYWKGKPAFVTQTQKEEIGEGVLYKLECRNGKTIYNGDRTWFPESFVEFRKTA